VAVITDARFSGVSTGACIGHVSPEALAGGPLGKLVEGDVIGIEIDTRAAIGSVELVAHGGTAFTPPEAAAELARRPSRADLAADPRLPADTRLWAMLQEASGGVWAGCVYDDRRIAARLAR
jgi:dihydroxyacid dehydratase/phosphogluconate dehydratase